VRHKLRVVVEEDSDWECCGEADSGETAIIAAADSKPDAIVIDVSMPGMGGLKATEVIHQAYPSIKIIVLTLHVSGELMRAAFSMGAAGYVMKSNADHILVTALNTVLSGRQYVPEEVDD
jgi:DNA-binding NarL/FixJ family response regulator